MCYSISCKNIDYIILKLNQTGNAITELDSKTKKIFPALHGLNLTSILQIVFDDSMVCALVFRWCLHLRFYELLHLT